MRLDIYKKPGRRGRVLSFMEMKKSLAPIHHKRFLSEDFHFKALKSSLFSLAFGAFMVLGAISAKALELKPGAVLPLSISSKGLTRISLKGEGVKDVFLYPGTAQEGVMLHKSGDIFISPQKEGFFMTLMGSKGTKQDFDVSFAAINAAPIILEHEVSPKKWTEAEIGKLLMEMHHKTPDDLKKDFEPWVFEEKTVKLAPDVTFQITGAFRHQNITLLKGEIKNHSSCSFQIKAESFPFMQMMSFETPVVPPKHHGTLYFLNKGDVKNA